MKKTKKHVIKFSNIIKHSKNHYFVPMVSYHDIANLIGNSLCKEERLRRFVSIDCNSIDDTILSINNKKISDINEMMQQGRYTPTTLTFNLEADIQLEYDEQQSELKLYLENNQKITILDGLHRMMAISKLLDTNSEATGYMILNLFIKSEEGVLDFLYQELSGKGHYVGYVESFNRSNPWYDISKRLNTIGDRKSNVFKDRIYYYKSQKDNAIVKIPKKDQYKRISIAMVAGLLEMVYINRVNEMENRELALYIVEGSTYILGDLLEDLNFLKNIKPRSTRNIYYVLFVVLDVLHDYYKRNYTRWCELCQIIDLNECADIIRENSSEIIYGEVKRYLLRL